MIRILLLLMGALITLSTLAHDFTYEYNGQTLTYSVINENTKSCLVKKGEQISGDLEIPAIARDGDQEYTVTKIGEQAFYSCNKMTSVIIPNSVTSIYKGAFRYCSGLVGSLTIPSSVRTIEDFAFFRCENLTSIIIPNTLTSIGNDAFAYCTGLSEVHISDLEAWCKIQFNSNPLTYAHHLFINGEELKNLEIPTSITSVGNYAFSGCSGLSSLKIHDSVTSIGWCTFYGCSGLTSLTIPNSVSSIDYGAFMNCSGLTGELLIPNSVSYIGDAAFNNCKKLNSVLVSNSLTTIGNEVFSHCEEMRSLIIPQSIVAIGDYAFSYCESLTSIEIPNSVTSIGHKAFEHCTGLTSIKIPNSVLSIGLNAFYYCTNLAKVELPNSVMTIGNNAFQYCVSLLSVYYGAKDPIVGTEDWFMKDSYEEATLYVPEGSIQMYLEIAPWKYFKNIQTFDFDAGIEGVITDIDQRPACEMYDLKGIKISKSTEALPSGLYVLRQGSLVKKIIVK